MKDSREKRTSNIITEDPRIFLAIERTFLAWIRTAIAFLAFGIAIEKFDFFLRSLETSFNVHLKRISAIHHLGKILIFIGLLTLIFGILNFLLSLRKIKENYYKTSTYLYILYALLVGLIAIGLLISFFAL